MTKYSVGDVLEILEDFVLECAVFSEGEKYAITEVEGNHYYLNDSERFFVNTISEVDAHPGFRKVVPEVGQEDIGGWDREEFASAAHKLETVSVDALREAWDYVDHEYPDIEKLIKLAKRLS